ncbi:MAG: winged helix-turn-helix domain-containing protein [Actinomycetota bacterium]
MAPSPHPVHLSRRRARQLAVMGQLLDAPRPQTIEQVVRGLGMVQEDPTAVVARTEHLVLWSRLGRSFRLDDLDRLLYRDRTLFEYWVHIVPMEDYPIHRASMRSYPPKTGLARHEYVREWLVANDSFRRHVLTELRRRGPLRSRDIEDRAAVPWRTGGWNDDRPRHVGMLLDLLWDKGEIAIVGRDGNQRLWDLASRSYPPSVRPMPARELARTLIDRQLRARGVDTPAGFGRLFTQRAPGWERALRDLVAEGVAVPVEVDGLPGPLYAHGDLLDRPFRGRTTLLSPFDDLISDRDRTERLFGMRYRIEIYVPKTEREFGYFVLPILRGDRLVGRLDPAFDRTTHVLRVHAVHAQPEARPADRPSLLRAIHELAAWLGAEEVLLPRLPAVWR